jgi:hypothetical protein
VTCAAAGALSSCARLRARRHGARQRRGHRKGGAGERGLRQRVRFLATTSRRGAGGSPARARARTTWQTVTPPRRVRRAADGAAATARPASAGLPAAGRSCAGLVKAAIARAGRTARLRTRARLPRARAGGARARASARSRLLTWRAPQRALPPRRTRGKQPLAMQRACGVQAAPPRGARVRRCSTSSALRPARCSAAAPPAIQRRTHTAPGGVTLEVLHASGGAAAASKPPLLFVHGSFHAAWCWAEHWLGYYAALGYDAHAVSLRGQARAVQRKHGESCAESRRTTRAHDPRAGGQRRTARRCRRGGHAGDARGGRGVAGRGAAAPARAHRALLRRPGCAAVPLAPRAQPAGPRWHRPSLLRAARRKRADGAYSRAPARRACSRMSHDGLRKTL